MTSSFVVSDSIPSADPRWELSGGASRRIFLPFYKTYEHPSRLPWLTFEFNEDMLFTPCREETHQELSALCL